jgi:thioredoxin 1
MDDGWVHFAFHHQSIFNLRLSSSISKEGKHYCKNVIMTEALNTNTNSSAAPGAIVHCNSEDEYYTALEAAGDRLVVVDCFAEWCPPCQQIAPVFSDLASQYPNVVFIKVDMDKVSAKLKTVLGVWALPTFCFFRYGKKVGSFMGANERLLIKGLEHNGEVNMCSSMCMLQ